MLLSFLLESKSVKLISFPSFTSIKVPVLSFFKKLKSKVLINKDTEEVGILNFTLNLIKVCT